MNSIKYDINLANNYYNERNFELAELAYKKILENDKNNIQLIFKLANIYNELGKFEPAIEYYKKCIDLNPNAGCIYKNFGICYAKSENYNLAIENYKKSIELDGDDSNTMNYLGIAYNKQGIKYSQMGNLVEAIKCFKNVIALKPDFLAAYNDLGICYYQKKDYDKAIETYKQALLIKPNYFVAFNNIGINYFEKENYEKAIENYKKAIELNPAYIDAFNNIGNAYNKIGEYENAIEYLKKTLALKPEDCESHYNIGKTYALNKSHDKAIEAFKKSLTLNPKYIKAYFELATLYLKLCEYDFAIEYYKKLLEIDANNSDAWVNLGVTYFNQKNFDLAKNCYKKAIEIRPDFDEVIYKLSETYLLNGDYKKGWDIYDCRLALKYDDGKYKVSVPRLDQPQWQGNSLQGKTIYVYSEQGFGDTIMFSRFLPFLSSMGANVLFQPKKELESLFQQNKLNTEIVLNTGVVDFHFDEHIALMSLPRILNINLNNIPLTKGYIKANIEKSRQYKEKFFNNDEFKVGIFWQGNPNIMQNRSTKLENFFNLSKIDGIKLYSMQKGFGVEQLQDIPPDIKIMDIGSGFDDYTDTAAAIENLDLLITVDTSIAHLAGAMGKPTWVLLPYLPDWRWLKNGADTPWYNDIKLFRQNQKDNWSEVFEEIKICLSASILESRK